MIQRAARGAGQETPPALASLGGEEAGRFRALAREGAAVGDFTLAGECEGGAGSQWLARLSAAAETALAPARRQSEPGLSKLGGRAGGAADARGAATVQVRRLQVGAPPPPYLFPYRSPYCMPVVPRV